MPLPAVPAYPLTKNEDERLQEVLRYDFVDGGLRESLDQLCLLAQSLFKVPVALVTLVGRDEQTFLAKCGVDANGTSRKDAFCSYTILSDEVFVVSDATQDPRFENNPLVTGEMHVRFYAGAPLTVRPGVSIGAFCLIDTQPREFSDAEATQLQMLAGIAVNELRRRRAGIDLRREQDLLVQTARIAKVGSWTMDLRTGELSWSDETYRMFGLEPGSPVDPQVYRRYVAPAGAQRVTAAMEALVREGAQFEEEVELFNALDEHRWVRCLAVAEKDASGEVLRLTGSIQDVTREHEQAAEIERLAYRDPLTGLPNRALFHKVLAASLERARREGHRVGLVMLDLDHFKDVNDTLGHDAGDSLLRSVADRLREVYRESDTIARLGGDEFAIIIPGIRRPDDLRQPAEKLLEVLRHPLEHGGASLSITASVGTALFPQDDSNPSELLIDVDIALHRAKGGGRNRVVRFNSCMRNEVSQRIELLRRVRQGVAAGEFVLHYQPLVALRPTRTVAGFEALMRWNHPERGVLPPHRFLAALEDQELSLALGQVALDTAVAQMRAWMEQGVEFGRVAVNLSASQFRAGDLARAVEGKLKHWGVPPQRLILEVTENVYMGWSSDVVAETIKRLHAMGVLIALDDFGTGYASLANLRQFPIDKLKIDKSFIQNREDIGIVKAVLTLSRSLGFKVIAEGVEDERQLEELDALGCDQVQGYYFARPMPGAEVPRFLRNFDDVRKAPDRRAVA